MTRPAGSRVPVVMPIVEVRFGAAGTASVTVDQRAYEAATEVGRKDLELVVQEIAALLGPVRVQVTEANGSEFTDIVIPHSETAIPCPAQVTPISAGGTGFLPHEDVAVAVIISTQKATDTGNATLRLPPALLGGDTAAVVILGRTSGRFVVCEAR